MSPIAVAEAVGIDVDEAFGADGERVGLIDAIRDGLPWTVFEQLCERLGVSQQRLAEVLLIPARTLTRRRKSGTFHADESDRIIRVARVYAHARYVFESPEAAAGWLLRDNAMLEGAAPLSLLDTGPGVRLVDELLGRIEHGVFS